MNYAQAKWVAGRQAWEEFCRANPALGLLGTRPSYLHFVRTYAQDMIDAGVALRGTSNRLLVNSETFGQAAFQVMTRQAVQVDQVLAGTPSHKQARGTQSEPGRELVESVQ